MKTTNDTRPQEVKLPKTVKLSTVIWVVAIVVAFMVGWFTNIHYTNSVNASIDKEVSKRFEQVSKTNQ